MTSQRQHSGVFGHLQITREATLAGGLSIWRMKSLLFVIEHRTARVTMPPWSLRALLALIAQSFHYRRACGAGRQAGAMWFWRLTVEDLECCVPLWAAYVPRDPATRAALAHLLGQRYHLTAQAVPNIRAALGLDTRAVQQAYWDMYRQPLAAVFAPQSMVARRAHRWFAARTGRRARKPGAIAAQTFHPSAFAVFRHRNFTLLWIAQLVSVAGSALTQLAAGILVYQLTGSALNVGLLLMATALPSLFIGLIAGVFVDRWDRKRIMIAADLSRAGLIGIIPFLVPFSIAWLYVIAIVSSVVGQFFNPAHASVLPETASDDELAAANALIAISSFGAPAIGFAASGLIASRFPIEWAFELDALSFVVSALCIWQIRVAPLKVGDRTTVTTVLRNLRDGMGFLLDTPCLRSLFLIYLPIFISFGFGNTLILPFALRALHATEFEYGLLQGIEPIGLAAGSLLMARVADRLHEGQWLVLSFLGMGIAYALFAMAFSMPLAIMLYTVSGFLNAPSVVARQLLIQRNTPREVRGRVNSAFFATRDVEFAIGMAAAGLADLFDVRLLFFIGALIVFGGGLLTLLLPGLRQPLAEWRRRMRLLPEGEYRERWRRKSTYPKGQ